METFTIKDLERKAYGSVFQDGLWDVFVGFFMAQFAIGPLLSDLGFNDFWSSMIWTFVILMVLVAIWFLKKYVVAPRIGTVRFKKRNKSRYLVVMGVLNATLFLGALIGIFYMRLAGWKIDWLPPLTLILVVLTGFSAVAWLFRQPRFHLYGALCAIGFAGGELLYRYAGASHHGWPITFGIISCLVTFTGIFLFVTFIRKYPKINSDLYLQGGNDDNG